MRSVVAPVELHVVAAEDESVRTEHVVEQRRQGRGARLRAAWPADIRRHVPRINAVFSMEYSRSVGLSR